MNVMLSSCIDALFLKESNCDDDCSDNSISDINDNDSINFDIDNKNDKATVDNK